MTNFYLIRHGQSLGNVDFAAHHEYGDPGLPLTELGTQQAATTANFLRQLFLEKIANGESPRILIIHSPYERAWHTADCIDTALRDMDVKREQHIGLREQNYGLWDGVEEKDYKAIAPLCYKKWQADRARGHAFYAPMPEGETVADVWSRVKSEALPSIYRDIIKDDITDVIVVSHGVTTRALITALTKSNQPMHEVYSELRNPPNGSVHAVTPNPDYVHRQFGHHNGRNIHKGILFDPNNHLPDVTLNNSAPVLRLRLLAPTYS